MTKDEGAIKASMQIQAGKFAEKLIRIHKQLWPNHSQTKQDREYILQTAIRMIDGAVDQDANPLGLIVFNKKEEELAREILKAAADFLRQYSPADDKGSYQLEEYTDAAGNTRFKLPVPEEALVHRGGLYVFAADHWGMNMIDFTPITVALTPIDPQNKSRYQPSDNARQYARAVSTMQNIFALDHILACAPKDAQGNVVLGAQDLSLILSDEANKSQYSLHKILSMYFPLSAQRVQITEGEQTLLVPEESVAEIRKFIHKCKKELADPYTSIEYGMHLFTLEKQRQQCWAENDPANGKDYRALASFITLMMHINVAKITKTGDTQAVFETQQDLEISQQVLRALAPECADDIIESDLTLLIPKGAMDIFRDVYRKIDKYSIEQTVSDLDAAIAKAPARAEELQRQEQERIAARARREGKKFEKLLAAEEEAARRASMPERIIAKSELEVLLEPLTYLENALAIADRLINRDARLGDKYLPSKGEICLEFKTDQEADAVAEVLQRMAGDQAKGITAPKEDIHKHKLLHPVVVTEAAHDAIKATVAMFSEEIQSIKNQFRPEDRAASQAVLDAVLEISGDMFKKTAPDSKDETLLEGLPAQKGHQIG